MNRRAAKLEREVVDDMREELEAYAPSKLARMQNVINWCARAAFMNVQPKTGVLRGYFIGHVIDEIRALANDDALREPDISEQGDAK